MEFNIENYKNKKVAMHCKTIEGAKSFCTILNHMDITHESSVAYSNSRTWDLLGQEICYDFNNGSIGSVSYFLANGYTVLEWSDFTVETVGEHFKDEIWKVACTGASIAVNKYTGELRGCCASDCESCLFSDSSKFYGLSCADARKQWANSPYLPDCAKVEWINKWSKLFEEDTHVTWAMINDSYIVVDSDGKTGVAHCGGSELWDYKTGTALAYAAYCNEPVPKTFNW